GASVPQGICHGTTSRPDTWAWWSCQSKDTRGCLADRARAPRHASCLWASASSPAMLYSNQRLTHGAEKMDLNGLPADVAQFVDAALAGGKYPSAEALVAAALQVLQQQEEEDRGTLRPAAASEAGSLPASPDDYLQALAVALRTGEFGRARQLALD